MSVTTYDRTTVTVSQADYRVVASETDVSCVTAETDVSCVTVEEGTRKPVYDGPTELTPADVVQTVHTANKVVLSDVVVGPIPPQYVIPNVSQDADGTLSIS